MRNDVDAVERQRSARRNQNVRCRRRLGDDDVSATTGNARTSSPTREAAPIRDGDSWQLHTDSPGRHPLVPVLALTALGQLHVVDLLQVVADHAHRQSKLKREEGLAVDDASFLGDAKPEHRVREAEPVFDRARTSGDRLPADRLDRSFGVRPRVTANGLEDRIDAPRRAEKLPAYAEADVVRMRTARVPRDVHDLVVRNLRMRRQVDGEACAGPPPLSSKRLLVLEMGPPGVRTIVVMLDTLTRNRLPLLGIPEP